MQLELSEYHAYELSLYDRDVLKAYADPNVQVIEILVNKIEDLEVGLALKENTY